MATSRFMLSFISVHIRIAMYRQACTHGDMIRDINAQTHILSYTKVRLLTLRVEQSGIFAFRENLADVVTLCFISLTVS